MTMTCWDGRQKYIEAYLADVLCNPVEPYSKMLFSSLVPIAFAASAAAQVTAQNSSGTRLRVDNGTYGPGIEEVHYCESHPNRLNAARL